MYVLYVQLNSTYLLKVTKLHYAIVRRRQGGYIFYAGASIAGVSCRRRWPPPTTLVLTTLVAQCKLSRRKIGLLLEVAGRKFSHSPGNPATVGVVRWPAAGDTAGSSLRRLSSLQHRIYNLLGRR